MKNVIKKISAFAMAFTLLGTGTSIFKVTSTNDDHSLIAHADYCCQHDMIKEYSLAATDTDWELIYREPFYIRVPHTIRSYNVTLKCPHCGFVFGYSYESFKEH